MAPWSSLARVFALACLVLAASASGDSSSGGDNAGFYPFTLPELPYDTNALEPAIDNLTTYLHWFNHTGSYVVKLNAALEGECSSIKEWSLLEMVQAVGERCHGEEGSNADSSSSDSSSNDSSSNDSSSNDSSSNDSSSNDSSSNDSSSNDSSSSSDDSSSSSDDSSSSDGGRKRASRRMLLSGDDSSSSSDDSSSSSDDSSSSSDDSSSSSNDSSSNDSSSNDSSSNDSSSNDSSSNDSSSDDSSSNDSSSDDSSSNDDGKHKVPSPPPHKEESKCMELSKECTKEVRLNAGGLWNHALYFLHNLATYGSQEYHKDASKELQSAIDHAFGSYEDMVMKLSYEAIRVPGSGWAWLIVGSDGKTLEVTTSAYQDNPLMHDPFSPLCEHNTKTGYPILGIDVWEHSYYLKYQNRREEYVAAFFDVVNWRGVSHLYESATQGAYDTINVLMPAKN